MAVRNALPRSLHASNLVTLFIYKNVALVVTLLFPLRRGGPFAIDGFWLKHNRLGSGIPHMDEPPITILLLKTRPTGE